MDGYDFTVCHCKACGGKEDVCETRFISDVPTPWAVWCQRSTCGKVYLTSHGYNQQMNRANQLWKCPNCDGEACWDDDNFQQAEEVAHLRFAQIEFSPTQGELP